MKTDIKIIIAVIFALLVTGICSFASSDKTVRFGSSNYEPYTGENLSNGGFITEIVTEAFNKVGYKAQFTYQPWKRVLITTKKGKFHGVPALYFTKERAEFLEYSNPVWKAEIIFISLKEKNIKYSKISDLKSYTVGVERGGAVEDYMVEENLKTASVTTLTQNIKKLLAKRVDLVIAPKDNTDNAEIIVVL